MKHLVLLLCACAPPAAARIDAAFALTASECPSLPFADIRAELVIEGVDLSCPLTVAMEGTVSTVSGECADVPTGEDRRASLVWFVLSPTQKKKVVLAEAVALLPLSVRSQPRLDAEFTGMTDDLLPQTRALPSEPYDRQDRYNCDRVGQSFCDSGGEPSPTQNSRPPSDTCSNLEELCRGTLFTTQNDTTGCGP